MEQSEIQAMMQKLSDPFPPSEIHWRVGTAAKDGSWIQLLAYVDARMVMDRLDAVFPGQWRDEYQKHPGCDGVLCGISVLIDGQWVTRWDGADATDVEAAKGVLSDAFKRAAVKWGIGRYLYELGTTWATIVDKSVARKAGKAGGSHKRKDGAGYVSWVAPNDALKAVGAEPLPTVSQQAAPKADKLAGWRKRLHECTDVGVLGQWFSDARAELSAEERRALGAALREKCAALGTTLEALMEADNG